MKSTGFRAARRTPLWQFHFCLVVTDSRPLRSSFSRSSGTTIRYASWVPELDCGVCYETIPGTAYVFDTHHGRSYTCTSCWRKQRDEMAHDLTLAMVSFERKHQLLQQLEEMRNVTPLPCVVCGRRFAWMGGQGPRRWPQRNVSLEEMARRWPQRRVHICSEVCRRERRNQARRVDQTLRSCEKCGHEFMPRRADARYCTAKCRQAAFRVRTRAS